jgi:TetR/AcrR family transcriptional regulator, transcriptional repressor for nem operon
MLVDTRRQILDAAAEFAQRLGFSAFSYADIADRVGIRKASIHHHFPSKESLELALVDDYRAQFNAALDSILAQTSDAVVRLRRYAALYQKTLQSNRMCLCGMLASDVQALPESLRDPLRGFFADQVSWLAKVLKQGKQQLQFNFGGKAESRAENILVSLQGALLLARVSHDEALIARIIEQQLAMLRP